MIEALRKIDPALRGLVNRWWRPGSAVAVCAGLWVNLVVEPLITGKAADLAGMGAMFAGLATLFGVRELGKRWGTAPQ